MEHLQDWPTASEITACKHLLGNKPFSLWIGPAVQIVGMRMPLADKMAPAPWIDGILKVQNQQMTPAGRLQRAIVLINMTRPARSKATRPSSSALRPSRQSQVR